MKTKHRMAKPSDEDTAGSTDMPYEEGKTEDENPYGTDNDNDNDDDGDDELAASADEAKDGEGGDSGSSVNEEDEVIDSMINSDARNDHGTTEKISLKDKKITNSLPQPLRRNRKTKKSQSVIDGPRKVDGSPPRKKRPSVVQDIEEAPIREEAKKKRKKKPNPIYATTEQSENDGNISTTPTSTPRPPRKRESPSKSPPPIMYPLYPLKFEARNGTNYQSRKNVHSYALKMVALVCEQNDVAIVNNRNNVVTGSTTYNNLPYKCLDVPPPSLGYTVDTEPEKLKRMRLNVSVRVEILSRYTRKED